MSECSDGRTPRPIAGNLRARALYSPYTVHAISCTGPNARPDLRIATAVINDYYIYYYYLIVFHNNFSDNRNATRQREHCKVYLRYSRRLIMRL